MFSMLPFTRCNRTTAKTISTRLRGKLFWIIISFCEKNTMCNRYIFFLHLTFDLEYINPRIKYKSVDLLNYKQFYL